MNANRLGGVGTANSGHNPLLIRPHARTAFTGAGNRHLQGCYADLDGVASALAVLNRNAQEESQ